MKHAIGTLAVVVVLHAGNAGAAAPVCGDVNASNTINATDALLVLKKGVQLPITLNCSGYEDAIATCQEDLEGCESNAVCGDGIVTAGSEACDVGDLGGATCKNHGFAGGDIACATGCTLDTSHCYYSRFELGEGTLIDHKTGLEWERKNGADGSTNFENIHDVDNTYKYCDGVSPNCTDGNNPFDGNAATIFLAQLNGGSTNICFADHCDWRIPTLDELKTITILTNCAAGPCVVDGILEPMAEAAYLTSTPEVVHGPNYISTVLFDVGQIGYSPRSTDLFVRAVRTAD